MRIFSGQAAVVKKKDPIGLEGTGGETLVHPDAAKEDKPSHVKIASEGGKQLNGEKNRTTAARMGKEKPYGVNAPTRGKNWFQEL